MNPIHILALSWARSLEFLRDRGTMAWNFALPLLMVAGFAVIFSGPGKPLFTVAVLAPETVPLSADTHPFLGTPSVSFYREASLEKAQAKVQRHRIDLAVDLVRKQYWVNPESHNGAVLEQLLHGVAGEPLRRQEVQGARIRYVDWAAPGVLGMNLMFSCLFGTGYVIVRYRKSGYLKRLNATPLTAAEFIVAQLLSRLVLVLLVTVAVYLGCNAFLHFRLEGSPWALLLVTVVGSYAMIALGLLVAARVTSEEFAGGLLNLVSWPMMVLSGVFFSIDGAPAFVQWLAQWLPLTPMLEAARAIMLDGAGLLEPSVLQPLLQLSAMALLFTLLGALGFKWTQD